MSAPYDKKHTETARSATSTRRLAPASVSESRKALTSSKPALAIIADLGLKATARLGPFG